MKILLAADICENQINGVATSFYILKEELLRLGHDVRLLALSSELKSVYKDNDYFMASANIPIYPDARYSFKISRKMLNQIKEWGPDIVHIQTEFSSRHMVMKIVRSLNIPFVFTCHTMYEDYIKYISPSRTLGLWFVKAFSRKCYNKAATLIVPSNKLKIKQLSYNIKCPIEIIPTGIDLNKYKKKLSFIEKKKILSDLGLKDNNKYLVSVSRVAAEKNIEEIINYMPSLIAKDKEIKLIIVGDGPNKKNLENLVKELKLEKSVIFTGMVKPDEVYKYYQLGNIFVNASTSESQGLTYVEALANKLPLVCKKDECLDEVIDVGLNGYTFETKKEFVNYCYSIINDKKLAKKMGEVSLAKSNDFSKEIFGEKVEALYIKILNDIENNNKK